MSTEALSGRRAFVRAPHVVLAAVAAALLVSAAINLTLHLTSRSGVETVWTHDGRFLRAEQGADSWKAMEAARVFAGTHRSGLYEQVFFTDAIKFQYPPSALLIFGTLHRPALNLISWMATLVAAALIAVILRSSLSTAGGYAAHQPEIAPAIDLLVMLAALSFYPFIKAYSLGQIQAWLNLLFAAVVLAWMLGARGVAGALLGLMCLVKPTYGLLYVWGAARRERRFVVCGAVVFGAGLALSLWRYSLHDHLEYLKVLSYIAKRGETFYANQSINGALNRALFNGSSLDWQDHAFPPVHPLVYLATTAAFVLLGAASLKRPRRGAGTIIDFSIAALATTLTAPLAWEHHYGILLPMYAAVTPFVIVQRPLARWTAVAMGASYLVAANYFQFTNRFAGSWLNPLQSYLLGAALLFWAILYRAAHAPFGRDRVTTC